MVVAFMFIVMGFRVIVFVTGVFIVYSLFIQILDVLLVRCLWLYPLFIVRGVFMVVSEVL